VLDWGMRAPLLLIPLLALCACVAPQKLQKARRDYSAFSAERHDRDVEDQCADQAVPGTTANLACQLGLQKQAQKKSDAPAR
jgi:hypothetical protein